jgi:hypothetical protein
VGGGGAGGGGGGRGGPPPPPPLYADQEMGSLDVVVNLIN